ncbi:hypothetical protein [Corynebacterium sp. YSMAA5_1_F9]|uniref:hypothetical protein n=1 Tax=unclassified Corynebacterium TaxID=2624378 RepID=UPI0038D19A52
MKTTTKTTTQPRRTNFLAALTAVVTVTAAALSSCGVPDPSDIPFLDAEGDTAPPSATESAASTESTEEECPDGKKLEETGIGPLLKEEKVELKDSQAKIEGLTFNNISVAQDRYNPCKPYSYIVLEGDVAGEPAQVPVFFFGSLMASAEYLMVTTESLTITPQGEGFVYRSEPSDNLAGLEGNVGTPGPDGKPDHSGETTGPEVNVKRLILPYDAVTRREIEHLSVPASFRIRTEDLTMVCFVDEQPQLLECVREDGEVWQDTASLKEKGRISLDLFRVHLDSGELERYTNSEPIPESDFRDLPSGKTYELTNGDTRTHIDVNDSYVNIKVSRDEDTQLTMMITAYTLSAHGANNEPLVVDDSEIKPDDTDLHKT